MSVYLHIGLQKTASTFLQENVFRCLDSKEIEYNPQNIISSLAVIIKRLAERGEDEKLILKAKTLVEHELNKSGAKDILISYEDMSNLFCKQNYEENVQILKRIFPNAQIILFLRFQPDWLLSMYKEAIYQGDIQEIESFLNFENGKFEACNGCYNKKNLLQMDIYLADFSVLIEAYIKNYRKENVHIFFYERFQEDKKATVDQICNILEVTNRTRDYDIISRRSYSALACKLSIYRFNILKSFGLQRLIPTVKERRMKIGKIKKEPESTWASLKQQECFYILLPIIFKKFYRHFKKLISWRIIMKCYLDKIAYVDWDLLAKYGMRQKLEKFYRFKNREILKYISKCEIPERYLSY